MKATIKDRIVAHRSSPDVYDPPSFEQMADRIEELEELLKAAQDDAKEAEAYAEELEAKLAKAVEALRFYAQGEWPGDYPGGVLFAAGDDTPEFKTHIDYGYKARTTLAELTGGKDE